MTIEIMNLRVCKPSKLYDVRVDRSSILGNPFPMKAVSQRDRVCDQYAEYAAKKIKESGAYRQEMIRLYRLYKEHGQLRLFCWCAPKRCHAETIKKYLEQV